MRRAHVHLIITDSGLGGLTICAAIARHSVEAAAAMRITYVNAWPEAGTGYNDLPDIHARASAFDRVLHAIAGFSPDEVLIACNTLSVVYERTEVRKHPPVRIRGIIGAGVDLFEEHLAERPRSSILLLGTRTTIESGEHQHRLVQKGISAERIASVSCHGLAAAIERGPDSAATAALIEDCATRAGEVMVRGEPSYVGLCCTHYVLVSDAISETLARKTGRPVLPLDPNTRMIREVVSEIPSAGTRGDVFVEVISKVALEPSSREAMSTRLEPISPETAAALRGYTLVPDLF
jgi:glutamate racemase